MTVSTTEDALLGGRVRLLQPVSGYRAAIDPVLLAAAIDAGPGERVLDAGTGVGAAALCLLARLPDLSVTGIEIQPDLAELARENAGLNGAGDRFLTVAGDLAAPPPPVAGAAFDWVITNPPYVAAGRGTVPPDRVKAAANIEGGVDLAAWLQACLRRLRPGGKVAVIHRADRLEAILVALAGRAGALTAIPFWPKEGQPARRVVVVGRKGARTPFTLAPGLVLHKADGTYTEKAAAILSEARPLCQMGEPALS